MTSVEQQDARLIAMDAATVAAIRLHAPEFEAAYLADDLPFWFECLLDRCVASAECIADEYWSDPAFIQAYATALPELLGRALASAAPIKDGSGQQGRRPTQCSSGMERGSDRRQPS